MGGVAGMLTSGGGSLSEPVLTVTGCDQEEVPKVLTALILTNKVLAELTSAIRKPLDGTETVFALENSAFAAYVTS